MRALYILLSLILYAASVDLYIWYFTNSDMDIAYLKAWYGISILFALACYKIDSFFGDITWVQINLRDVMFYAVVANIVITLFTHLGIIDKDDFVSKYKLFNGSIVATSIILLISGLRHGIFKQNTENAI